MIKVSELSWLIDIESTVAATSLSSGFDSLRKAHGYSKGSYYSAFFQLSIGIERLLKMVVCLDKINQGQFDQISNNFLRSFGHGIVPLLNKCLLRHQEIYNTRINFPSDSISENIFNFFESFATTTRYYNLDRLSDRHTGDDPLVVWRQIIEEVFQADCSSRRRAQLNSNLDDLCGLLSKSGCPSNVTRKGRNLAIGSGSENTLRELLMHEFAVRYCIWRIIATLKPVYTLLEKFSGRDYQLNDGTELQVLFLGEYFRILNLERKFVLRKRKFDFHEWI